jgi:formylglycine-generating enzyme required for sulfatase activity
MCGNVWEWCGDEQPKDANGDLQRVFRGGAWHVNSKECRAASRYTGLASHRDHALGLRLARVPVGKEVVRVIAPAKEKAASSPRKLKNILGMELVYIPPGKFRMGSPTSEAKRDNDEDQHEVEISAGFHMSVHEVTQAQFQQVMGYNPSAFSEKGMEKAKVAGMNTVDFPVEYLTWKEAVEFCDKLSRLPDEKTAARVYRLPTEAEWEYACRAGTTTPFHFGPSASATQANFWGHTPYGGAPEAPSLARTTRVGSFKPNGFGLYDMHGNVSEWCADYYEKDYYGKSALRDPKGPLEGRWRVFRGGSCYNYGEHIRAAIRGHLYQRKEEKDRTIGFRVVSRVSTQRGS